MANESGVYHKNINAGGLSVDLYSLDAFSDGTSSTPAEDISLKSVTVVFLLHGRGDTIEGMIPLKDGLFDEVKKRKANGEKTKRGLVVVIFVRILFSVHGMVNNVYFHSLSEIMDHVWSTNSLIKDGVQTQRIITLSTRAFNRLFENKCLRERRYRLQMYVIQG